MNVSSGTENQQKNPSTVQTNATKASKFPIPSPNTVATATKKKMDTPSTTTTTRDDNELTRWKLVSNEEGKLFHLPKSLGERCRQSYGWNKDMTYRVLYGYRQFIKLKVIHNDWTGGKIAVPPKICDVWMIHLQYTLQYVEACLDYCEERRVIHHDPDQQQQQEGVAIQRTAESIRKEFPEEHVDEDIWSFEHARPGFAMRSSYWKGSSSSGSNTEEEGPGDLDNNENWPTGAVVDLLVANEDVASKLYKASKPILLDKALISQHVRRHVDQSQIKELFPALLSKLDSVDNDSGSEKGREARETQDKVNNLDNDGSGDFCEKTSEPLTIHHRQATSAAASGTKSSQKPIQDEQNHQAPPVSATTTESGNQSSQNPIQDEPDHQAPPVSATTTESGTKSSQKPIQDEQSHHAPPVSATTTESSTSEEDLKNPMIGADDSREDDDKEAGSRSTHPRSNVSSIGRNSDGSVAMVVQHLTQNGLGEELQEKPGAGIMITGLKPEGVSNVTTTTELPTREEDLRNTMIHEVEPGEDKEEESEPQIVHQQDTSVAATGISKPQKTVQEEQVPKPPLPAAAADVKDSPTRKEDCRKADVYLGGLGQGEKEESGSGDESKDVFEATTGTSNPLETIQEQNQKPLPPDPTITELPAREEDLRKADIHLNVSREDDKEESGHGDVSQPASASTSGSCNSQKVVQEDLSLKPPPPPEVADLPTREEDRKKQRRVEKVFRELADYNKRGLEDPSPDGLVEEKWTCSKCQSQNQFRIVCEGCESRRNSQRKEKDRNNREGCPSIKEIKWGSQPAEGYKWGAPEKHYRQATVLRKFDRLANQIKSEIQNGPTRGSDGKKFTIFQSKPQEMEPRAEPKLVEPAKSKEVHPSKPEEGEAESVSTGYFKGLLANTYVKQNLGDECPPGLTLNKDAKDLGDAFVNFRTNTCDTHFDDIMNFLLVLSGKKQVYLAHPHRWKDLKEDKTRSGSSKYYLDNPFEEDLEGWIMVEAEAGDGLVIPPRWLHCIKSEAGTVGVSLKIVNAVGKPQLKTRVESDCNHVSDGEHSKVTTAGALESSSSDCQFASAEGNKCKTQQLDLRAPLLFRRGETQLEAEFACVAKGSVSEDKKAAANNTKNLEDPTSAQNKRRKLASDGRFVNQASLAIGCGAVHNEHNSHKSNAAKTSHGNSSLANCHVDQECRKCAAEAQTEAIQNVVCSECSEDESCSALAPEIPEPAATKPTPGVPAAASLKPKTPPKVIPPQSPEFLGVPHWKRSANAKSDSRLLPPSPDFLGVPHWKRSANAKNDSRRKQEDPGPGKLRRNDQAPRKNRGMDSVDPLSSDDEGEQEGGKSHGATRARTAFPKEQNVPTSEVIDLVSTGGSDTEEAERGNGERANGRARNVEETAENANDSVVPRRQMPVRSKGITCGLCNKRIDDVSMWVLMRGEEVQIDIPAHVVCKVCCDLETKPTMPTEAMDRQGCEYKIGSKHEYERYSPGYFGGILFKY